MSHHTVFFWCISHDFALSCEAKFGWKLRSFFIQHWAYVIRIFWHHLGQYSFYHATLPKLILPLRENDSVIVYLCKNNHVRWNKWFVCSHVFFVAIISFRIFRRTPTHPFISYHIFFTSCIHLYCQSPKLVDHTARNLGTDLCKTSLCKLS